MSIRYVNSKFILVNKQTYINPVETVPAFSVQPGSYKMGGFDLTQNDPNTILNMNYLLGWFSGDTSNYSNLNADMYQDLADFDNNNEINIADVTYMLQSIAGNTSGYPVVGQSKVYAPPDTTPPVIALNGGDVTIPVGGTYSEQGASATDNVDTNVTVSIDNSTVDTSTAGEYTVTYTATDAAGNQSQETITVTVAENSYSGPVGSTALTNDTIQTAVDDWVAGGTQKSNVIATYGYISDWNTSSVTVMTQLFEDKTTFNDDIGSWDVSNVTEFRHMFKNAQAFNQYIGNWDVSNATTSMVAVFYMFQNAYAFNQYIGNWEMNGKDDLSGMFHNATSFNQDLSNWDVSTIGNFQSAFNGATSFEGRNIRKWQLKDNLISSHFYRTFENTDMDKLYAGVDGWMTVQKWGEWVVDHYIFFNQPT